MKTKIDKFRVIKKNTHIYYVTVVADDVFFCLVCIAIITKEIR